MGKCRADVSTHSRLKAAGAGKVVFYFAHQCFNTQPPEGGWIDGIPDLKIPHEVSTHSRLKAAGSTACNISGSNSGFNTQPPEGGWRLAPA